jgi:hypothetical protein
MNRQGNETLSTVLTLNLKSIPIFLLFFKLWLVIATLENHAEDRSIESTKTTQITSIVFNF